MIFGPLKLDDALDAVLAHSVALPGGRLRKGVRLTEARIAQLRAAGIEEVIAARLESGDVDEDTAATRIARALAPDPGQIATTRAFTGRVNLESRSIGVMGVDRAAVDALNAIDPGITLATLPDMARVSPGQMLATVKIIPYAVPGAALKRAEDLLGGSGPVVTVHPVEITRAALLQTVTPGYAEKLLSKGQEAVEARLSALGLRLSTSEVVAHEVGAVAAALGRLREAPLILMLGASATSDRGDVGPAGLIAAGGRLERFGMPVDPGNLLFLGRLGETPVLGLPGCARAPALNGADWVLERIVCGLPVRGEDIARMGVGGLLKEVPTRPQPRRQRPVKSGAPRVDILLLAAGAGRRMRGADKLLETIDGQPQILRAARAALGSGARSVRVVLEAGEGPRAAALSAVDGIVPVVAQNAAEGMGASLAAGMRSLPEDSDAVIVALADMPDVTQQVYDRLIAAFDPAAGAEICRASAEDGTPGHPVLFGRRFYEPLAETSGDVGARDVVRAGQAFLVDVPGPGRAAVTDLDTPEDWAAYRAARG